MSTPKGFSSAAFTAHTQEFVDGWLADFAWSRQPLTRAVTRVTGIPVNQSAGEHGSPMTLWERPSTKPSWLIAGNTALQPNAEAEDLMYGDPFDERWYDAVEPYALTGTWLHPSTLSEVEGYLWATSGSALAIGVLDQENPEVPRRYDPALDPEKNNIGVVYFPLRAGGRIPYWVGMGYSPEQAGLYAVLVAITEAGIHESMEMFQNIPGTPVWSPHDRAYRIELVVTLADGFTEDATPH